MGYHEKASIMVVIINKSKKIRPMIAVNVQPNFLSSHGIQSRKITNVKGTKTPPIKTLSVEKNLNR